MLTTLVFRPSVTGHVLSVDKMKLPIRAGRAWIAAAFDEVRANAEITAKREVNCILLYRGAWEYVFLSRRWQTRLIY